MSRRCSITNKAVQAGNKVSHSNRKSRRRFLPNLQNVTLISDALGRNVYMRVSTNALRTIEINGGLDAYLLSTSTLKLGKEAQDLKKQIKKAIANKG